MLVPILLVRVDVVPEVGPDVTVDIFSLTICLGVVGRAEVEVCSEGAEEFLPKPRCEAWVTV
jgi:hypothetical protein